MENQSGFISKIVMLVKMCRLLVFAIFLSVFCLSTLSVSFPDDNSVEPSEVRVRVKEGWILGMKAQWQNGRDVFKFINIPYALPPIGKRRFENPEPIQSWPHTWDASKEVGDLVNCLSYQHVPRGPNKVTGQEDCLYLSIYTPWLPTRGGPRRVKTVLDVIVYIHGGAFMFGSMRYYNPAALMSRHDVVFVKLNYRLGPLGFLSTGDGVVPGNMGMKDQALALRWIRENISRFGGNPDSITIAGSSAGGASVHFHMLSPQSKGLFHRAISMSGTLLSPWTIAENLQEKSQQLAAYVGCPDGPSEAMVNCLKTRPATYLANAVKLLLPFLYNPFSPWGPTVDSFAPNPVLPDFPVRLMMKRKINDVPWINSLCMDEGLYPGAEFLPVEEFMNSIDKNWTTLAPHILDFNFTLESPLMEAAKIRHQYYKNEPITIKNYKPLIQMLGDRLYNVHSERASRYMSSIMISPVYFYIFNFRGRFSLSNVFSKTQTDYGVSHSDDVNYVIQFMPMILTNTTKEEENTMDFMCDLWASFAAKGKPHVDLWTPVRPTSFNYLQINSGDNQTLRVNVKEIGSRSFWDALPFKENNIWLGFNHENTKDVMKETDRENKV